MGYLETGLISTSFHEGDQRLALHPGHLAALPERLRRHLVLERGYGLRCGVGDPELEALGVALAGRQQILERCELVVLPKPVPRDLQTLREGAVFWGWPHCVQQRPITQAAIDRRLTVIAFEAMHHWSGSGEKRLHVLYKNNEIAGYSGVLHALQLTGRDGGLYGSPQRAVILGFGSVGRGAVHALRGRGYRDITIYTQRPPHLVSDQIPGCRYLRMLPATEPGAAMGSETWDGRREPLAESLVTADLIVNATLQNTDRPLMFLRPEEEARLKPQALVIDVSCDPGMGFPSSHPTRFAEPTFRVGRGTLFYAVDHIPDYLWDAASWEISKALMPYLETVMAGPGAWVGEPTVERAIEIREGVIENPKVLTFQKRAAEYPHPPESVGETS